MVRVRRCVAAAAGLVVLAAGSSGCGRGEFEDRTARVTVDGRTTVYEVDSCGLDGTTAFVVGRTGDGRVVQAVVGVEADDRSVGVPASSGLTFVVAGDHVAAFGDESWSRQGRSGRAPGRIASARVRGSRIQMAGGVEEVDADDRPTAATAGAADTRPFTFDARCDELD